MQIKPSSVATFLELVAAPQRNQIYSTREIYTALKLDDAPFLRVNIKDRSAPVQTDHCTTEQLLAVPGFADLRWRYLYTTREWIPIFSAVDDSAVLACIDVTASTDEYESNPGWWVTPKTLPRQQL